MRVKRGNVSHRKHKRVLARAEGYRGRSKSSYKIGKLRVKKGLQYAYRDRKVKKRVFRALWITRLSAATRELGMSYGRFINGLRKANIEVNRKVLSELAIREPAVFEAIVDRARAAAK